MFGFLRKRAPDNKKESKTGRAVFIHGKNNAEFSRRDYSAFADEAYRKNVVAYQAIDKTAKAVASIPWVIKDRNGAELENHPIWAALNRPNPMQSLTEFLQDIVGYYRISGNAYPERVVSGAKLLEMYVLRSDRMIIKPGETGMPKAYIYKVDEQNKITYDVNPANGQSDVRHIKTFNPLDDWYGMSPIEAASFGVDIHNEANAHNMGLLQNGGNPSGIFEIPADSELSEEEYKRLKADIEERMSGAANRGRPIIGEGGITWRSISFTPQAMDIIGQKDSSARDICLALSVPPLLLNIPGDSTYSNYKEARLAFYEETVIPLARHIVAEFNVWLEPYLRGAYIDLDMEECPPIVERRMTLWEMANSSTDLTINERREIKGYEPIPNGDDIYIPAGNLPLSFDFIEPGESSTPEEDAANAFGDQESDSDES